jgi:hypothetical protein
MKREIASGKRRDFMIVRVDSRCNKTLQTMWSQKCFSLICFRFFVGPGGHFSSVSEISGISKVLRFAQKKFDMAWIRTNSDQIKLIKSTEN